MDKKLRAVCFGVLILLWAGLAVTGWFSPDQAISYAERRPLQQLPALSVDTLLSGSFAEKFEDYTLDQFPMRDAFRTVKSLFSYKVLRQKDNNGIYMEDGHAAKLEYPLNSPSVSHAVKRFNGIYETYLQDTGSRIYMTVIPDKGYYLAQPNGYPTMEYTALFARLAEGAPWAKQVDITGDLQIGDYYSTDTHWRQEKLMGVAQKLCKQMGVTEPKAADFTSVLATDMFYGVYHGQAALPMEPDALYLLESELLKHCRVYNHETKAYQPVYDTGTLSGADPYEVYLSGAQALLTVENPNAETDRELILFRDSFGSALAPLLMQGYRSVTLVDLRYISTRMLGEYLSFLGQDVLFAYSTTILNNSSTLK